jgi:hypothetical protein
LLDSDIQRSPYQKHLPHSDFILTLETAQIDAPRDIPRFECHPVFACSNLPVDKGSDVFSEQRKNLYQDA